MALEFDNTKNNGTKKICKVLLDQASMSLKSALDLAVNEEDSGLDFQMWGAIVARDGTVCAVARSGELGQQWPGSRVIAEQKANTANAFSLDGLALSTANLFSAVQPGGSLYGLQHSNPIDTNRAYKGPYKKWGTNRDPMIGERVGGVNVFGGGFGLYVNGKVVGGVGVSGDTSCADHMIGWRVRHHMELDRMEGVGGISGDSERPDNIIYDVNVGPFPGGFVHPECISTGDQTTLPPVQL